MKLEIKKRQKEGGLFSGGRPVFEIHFKVQFTEIEKNAIQKYQLADELLYKTEPVTDGIRILNSLARPVEFQIKVSDFGLIRETRT